MTVHNFGDGVRVQKRPCSFEPPQPQLGLEWFYCLNPPMTSSYDWFDSAAPDVYRIQTQASGPSGSLPITEEMLLHSPSGDLFGMTQNAGMGWNPAEAGGKQFLILSTAGGLRAPDGKPIALGYHTGHWEIGLLVKAAAEEFRGVSRNSGGDESALRCHAVSSRFA